MAADEGGGGFPESLRATKDEDSIAEKIMSKFNKLKGEKNGLREFLFYE